ncbi:MAG: histidine kinase [Chitinophagales bacterium]
MAQPTGKKADQYRAVHWSVENGLPSDANNVMIKDVKGFLWIGSAEGELCRFDGASFKKYIPDPRKPGAINSGSIPALKEDSLHNIWIGTAKGLSRYDINADTFTNFVTAADPLNPNRSIVPFWCTHNDVYCLESGTRIVAYNIYSLKKKIIVTLTDSDVVQRNYPAVSYAIVDSVANCIWMLAGRFFQNEPGGLLQISLDDGKRQHYAWPCHKNVSGHRHYAEAMRFDSKRNSIWINSGDGLMEFSLTEKKFRQTDALNDFIKLKDYRDFVGIDIDSDGKIWMATYPRGIVIYDPETDRGRQLFSDPRLQYELGYGILHIYCDPDGIVWTSYYIQRGVHELLPFDPPVKRFTANPKNPDSLSNNFIHTIIPAADGKVWIGTNDGLNIFDPLINRFEVLREKDLPGMRGNSIKPLHIDTIHDKAWLNVGDMRKVYETTIYEMDIKTRRCQPIVFRDGAKHIDTVRINSYLTQPYKNGLLISIEKFGLFEVKAGSLFADLVIPFKKKFGRMVIKENRFLFLKNVDRYGSLPPNFTYENINERWTKIPHLLDSLEWRCLLYNENDQTHWVSLRYELTHYDKEFRMIKTYRLEDPYNGGIINMQTDNAGNIWMINDLQQIVRLNPATSIFTIMSETDGYQKQYFEGISPGAKDRFGNLYFGGRDLIKGAGGLDQIQPEKYSSVNSASAYLRGLAVNQKPFPLDAGINTTEELSLHYDQNTISIETGIVDHYSRGNGHLRFKLERNGKRAEWEYAPQYYTIRYDGLVPGRYKLILQASNAGNEFNGPEKIIMITISPAFWNTWWFRIGAGFCMLVIIYSIIRQWLKQKFRLRLERSEKEKQLAELHQQKSELEMQALRSQMNPHFIFNSLNSINRFILQNNRAQASEYLTKFSKLVRLILQNSQATLIPLESELESMQLYLDLEALRFDHHFDYKISVPKDLDVSALKVPPLIIQPYAENAIWHGLMHKEEKGRLDIEISQEDDWLFFKIADDGIGRKQAAAMASKSATRHKSMGLRITAERIAAIQGQGSGGSAVTINDLVATDGSAAGTEIIIKLPVIYDQSNFNR